jgi:phosphoribosylamine--glycine ligase
MGAYSGPSVVDANMSEWLLTHVTRPVIQAMKSEGAEYRGVLYCGLMMTAKGPMVLEFNCRFGDPETQPILMRLESDLLGAFIAAAEGRLSEGDLKWSKDSTVCVVMASKGYPDNPELGKTIHGLPEADEVTGVKVFHAGTRKTGDQYVTNGGRVLGVTARAVDLKSAVDRAYEAVGKIKFEGMQYRRDIAARGLRGK